MTSTSATPTTNNSFGLMPRNDEPEDEEEEEDEDGGVWFYVNKSGFPMDCFTYDRMWNHVSKLHPDGLDLVNRIRDSTQLPEVCSSICIPS